MKHILILIAFSLTFSQSIVTDITLENQMTTFMDKHAILGEWLAYFHNPRFCKNQRICKDRLSQLQQLSKKS
jgi:hypothetical protein